MDVGMRRISNAKNRPILLVDGRWCRAKDWAFDADVDSFGVLEVEGRRLAPMQLTIGVRPSGRRVFYAMSVFPNVRVPLYTR